MTIPQSDIISTSVMNRVFDKTTATYKFYWMLSLLDMYVKEHKTEMPAIDIASRMVAYAWYPTEYFRLSFGKGDRMSQIIPKVAELTGITVDDKLDSKTEVIMQAIKRESKSKGRNKNLIA